ncbi:MAG: tryptophan synthase subunit alpha [Deltaproteobacteria bacterium]|nr:tryptophan synthase subunit alpha [Deltaproteobacteria bacterium]
MNRIKETFEKLKAKNEKALVAFVTAGDPNIKKSLSIIKNMHKAGVDILELGIPFSDPTADGPVIQRASARALKQGVNIKAVLKLTKSIREFTNIPIILFGYYNPIHLYGNKKFYIDAVSAGADGLLIVDLPPEESDEMTNEWEGNKLALIRLIALTTPKDRIKKIADSASGFLYLVSKIGVTGSAGIDTTLSADKFKIIRSITDLPVCVGFGISTPEHVSSVASFADGIVIGSAFEKTIEKNIDNPELESIIAKQTDEYKKATKNR